VLQLEVVALVIAGATTLVLALAATFIRLGHGRYAEKLLAKASRIRIVRRRLIRAYIRDLEGTDPLAARAFSKVERQFGDTTLRHSRAALFVLSPEERRAYLDLSDKPQVPLNRAHRRHMPKPQRRGRR
jgi:hypothetical protein